MRLERRVAYWVLVPFLASALQIGTTLAATVSLPAMEVSTSWGIEAPVTIDSPVELSGAQMTVTFDPAVLLPTGVVAGPAASGWSLVASIASPGEVRVSLVDPGLGGVVSGGTLCTLYFHSTHDQDGSTALTIAACGLRTGLAASIPVTLEPGSVTVRSDLDGDGLPDTWEDTVVDAWPDRFPDIFAVLTTDDPDVDGACNLVEYRAGTNPALAASVPQPVVPDGQFLAPVSAAGVAAGRGLWDLTGSYTPSTKGSLRSLNLVHDPTGRLTGTATYAVAEHTAFIMPIKGSVKGTSGSITMKGSVRGVDPAKTVTVSLTLNLTVNTASRQLAGRLTGSTKAGHVSTPVNDPVVLDIPADTDGTWTLAFDLDQAGKKITGTATLTLSNTVDYDFVVQGRLSGAKAVLSLAGGPSDPAANAIKIKTIITTLEGNWARLESFSGKGYGQTIAW